MLLYLVNFEKINGYRDGIFLAHQVTLLCICLEKRFRMAVVDKINDAMSWGCKPIRM